MKIRITKLDTLFSKLVRERVNYVCEHTGENLRDGLLDCCHIMGRRGVALRWHPKNAIAMSRSSHIFFTQHPFDFADFCREKFGDELIEELRLISSKPVKWTKGQRDDIFRHYQREYNDMLVMRENGYQARIDFEPHEIMHVFGSQ